VKKIKILVVGFCLSALAVSCSKSEHEKVSEINKSDEKTLTSRNELNKVESRDKSLKSVQKSTDKLPLLGKRTISFNGGKYLFEGEKLRKGSQVRNIHMSESGTVKGTIVIVAKSGETLDLEFKFKTKIAKDTFRIAPAETDDLMTVYNELLTNKAILIVELEVEYSGKKSDALEY